MQTSHDSTPHNAPAGRAGFWVALLCAVHCMAVPVLLTAAPALLPPALLDGRIELASFGFALVFAYYQLWPEYKATLSLRPPALAAAGLCLMAAGILSEGGPYHQQEMIGGSLLLAGAFYLSHKLRYHAPTVTHAAPLEVLEALDAEA